MRDLIKVIRFLLIHLFFYMVIFFIVSMGSFLASYFRLRYEVGFNWEGWLSSVELNQFQKHIEQYRVETHRCPESLEQLMKTEDWLKRNEAGFILDHWGRRYHYETDGTNFELFSFGRDGQFGGVGLNADTYPDSAGHARQPPTLRQYYSICKTNDIYWLCVFAGLFAIFLIALTRAAYQNRKVSLDSMRFSIIAWIGFSFGVAVFLSAFAVPKYNKW